MRGKLLLVLLAPALALAAPDLDANKKAVTEFYDTAFNKKRCADAANLYLGEVYKQHNPHAGDGPKAFVAFCESYTKQNPQASAEIKRVIAEGDLVVVHVHAKANARDRGRAVMDILRVKDGKLVEHWDVVQPIPEKAANSNTMF